VPSKTYQKPLLSQRAAITMAKEKKNPIKSSEKAERPKVAGDEKETLQNHNSRPDNIVKKE
jgi:hypothetical protein